MDTREINPGFNDDNNNEKPDIDEIAKSLGDDDILFEEPDQQGLDDAMEVPGLEPVGSEAETKADEADVGDVFELDESLLSQDSDGTSLPELDEADMGLAGDGAGLNTDGSAAPPPLEEEPAPAAGDSIGPGLDENPGGDSLNSQDTGLESISDFEAPGGDIEEVNLDELNFDEDSPLPEGLEEEMDSDPSIEEQISAITSEFEEKEIVPDVPDVPDAKAPQKKSQAKNNEKKKGSKKLLLIMVPVFILLAGGGYYFYTAQSKESVKASPGRHNTRKKNIVKKTPSGAANSNSATIDSREIVKNPYIYSFAENIQKSIEDGITTYIYEAKSDIRPITEFYKSRLVSNGYKLKVQDYDDGSDYADMIFSRDGKDCSVILKKKRGKVVAVVSYIE